MTDIATQTETDTDLDFPSLWGVKFLNDDFTPMDFVIAVMMKYFALSAEAAYEATMRVHNEGEATVGMFTKDIAFTKAANGEQLALTFGHPLRLSPVAV